MDARSRLIFALDYATAGEAETPVSALRGAVGMVKVGLELFVREGKAAVMLGERAACPVFLDLKLHDIPETVGRAVRNLRPLAAQGVRFVTVHASGGERMLREAVSAAGGELRIVAVTVLTSLDAADLAALGIAGSAAEHVERLARLAHEAGVRDFVCSPAEAALLRRTVPDACIITPGVRPAGAAAADQKRVATPADAIRGGADMLVVGRPIRDADDPVAAARAIVHEIEATLA